MSLTPLISFQDAVTASNLNPNQLYAVYYIDGIFANRARVAARCPKAKLFGITVSGRTGADVFACDCEPGDLSAAEAEAWVAQQVKLGVPLVCVYASLDTWTQRGLLAVLAPYGHRIKRWVADFNNIPAIPSWADADQFADPGPVDLNVALANFFEPDLPPPPFTSFNEAFNAGFSRGFDVGYLRRRYRPLPPYVRPAGQRVAYNLGFNAGFVRGWVVR